MHGRHLIEFKPASCVLLNELYGEEMAFIAEHSTLQLYLNPILMIYRLVYFCKVQSQRSLRRKKHKTTFQVICHWESMHFHPWDSSADFCCNEPLRSSESTLLSVYVPEWFWVLPYGYSDLDCWTNFSGGI